MAFNWNSSRVKLIIMFGMTSVFMVTEVVVGYCGDSLTLVADSFHMLNDAAALTVAFITSCLSDKQWTRSTFGWARADVLGCMTNSVFLLALAFSIMVEAIKRFVHPTNVVEPRWVFFVGVIGLGINLIGLLMFKDHAHSHGASHHHGVSKSLPKEPMPAVIVIPQGDEEANAKKMNMRGVFLHVLADTMASIAVLVSAGVVWATEGKRQEDPDCWKYIDYIDPALSILIVFLIAVSTIPLLCEVSLILLQAVPSTLNIENIRKELEGVNGVKTVTELNIWQLTGTKIVASAHLKCIDLKEYDRIRNEATTVFKMYGVYSTTIEGTSAE